MRLLFDQSSQVHLLSEYRRGGGVPWALQRTHLVSTFQEISFSPELSSTPRFRIQGWGSLSVTNGARRMENLLEKMQKGLIKMQEIQNKKIQSIKKKIPKGEK